MSGKRSKINLPIPIWLRFYLKFSKILKNNNNVTFEMDLPKDIREGESLPVESISNFLRSKGFNTDNLSIKQFPSGFSNLTYYLKTNDHELVLRRPPYGADSLKGGHDMFREYQILKKLKTEFAKIPNVHFYSDDQSILGVPFYVMDCVKGYILRPGLSQKNAPDSDTISGIADSLVDTLVELHQVDLNKSELMNFGKIDGYVERQIAGWTKRYYHTKTDDIPEMDFIAKWLSENQPKESSSSIIHNDFKYDNMVLDPKDPTKVIAVLDWEMATLGDPLMDFGTTLGYWMDKNDPEELRIFQLSPTTLDGNPSRNELLGMYEKKSGKTIQNPTFYYVYGLFKIAIIAQQIYFRYHKGYTKDKRFSMLNIAVQSLGIMANQAIIKNRLNDLFE